MQEYTLRKINLDRICSGRKLGGKIWLVFTDFRGIYNTIIVQNVTGEYCELVTVAVIK